MHKFLKAVFCIIVACVFSASQTLASGYPTPIFKSVNKVLYSSGYNLGDWCADLNAAIADLPNGGTILVDDLDAIGSCSAAATITPAANTTIKFVSPGNYVLSEPIILGSSSIIEGLGGGIFASSGNSASLQALSNFPTSTALVKVFDARNAAVRDMVLDCNNVSGCVNVQYDSDNNPSSSLNEFKNLTLQNGQIGFACGTLISPLSVSNITVTGSGPYTATVTTSGTLPWAVGSTHGVAQIRGTTPSAFDTSGSVITVTSSTTFTLSYAASPGSYTSGGTVLYGNEADFASLHNIQISGNRNISNANGIQLNSVDCLQQSRVDTVFFQLLHLAVSGITGNGTVQFNNIAGGSYNGTSNIMFNFGDWWLGNYSIENSESEGTTGTGSGQLAYALLDSGGSQLANSRTGISHLKNNSFFVGNVDVFGGGQFLSEGNTISGTAQALGSTNLCSTQDVASWTTAGAYNIQCHFQGVGDADSNSPGSAVTVTNSATTVTTIGQQHTGTWTAAASVTFSTASVATNVTCILTDGTTTFGQATGYATTANQTNLSVIGVINDPVGSILVSCQTGTSSATATAATSSKLVLTRVNN